MPTFHLAKNKKRFIPADVESQIKANKIGQGEVVKCKSVSHRNYEFHKKFFALIHFAFVNLPEKYDGNFVDEEDLREELLKAVGWKKTWIDFNGNRQEKAKSISYDKCSQEKLENIYDLVHAVVCRLLDTDEEALMREVMDFI